MWSSCAKIMSIFLCVSGQGDGGLVPAVVRSPYPTQRLSVSSSSRNWPELLPLYSLSALGEYQWFMRPYDGWALKSPAMIAVLSLLYSSIFLFTKRSCVVLIFSPSMTSFDVVMWVVQKRMVGCFSRGAHSMLRFSTRPSLGSVCVADVPSGWRLKIALPNSYPLQESERAEAKREKLTE